MVTLDILMLLGLIVFGLGAGWLGFKIGGWIAPKETPKK